MWILALLPFLLQAIAMAVDEGYFHVRRGLPKWERIGHPLDTMSYLLCLGFVLWMPFNSTTLKVYIGLAVLSCLMVTKDEFIHKHHCPWAENWLHAVLFILHPIILICTGLIWPVVQQVEVPTWMAYWLDHPTGLYRFLWMQAVAVGGFLLYQIIFWNIIWRNSPVIKH